MSNNLFDAIKASQADHCNENSLIVRALTDDKCKQVEERGPCDDDSGHDERPAPTKLEEVAGHDGAQNVAHERVRVPHARDEAAPPAPEPVAHHRHHRRPPSRLHEARDELHAAHTAQGATCNGSRGAIDWSHEAKWQEEGIEVEENGAVINLM